MGARSIVLACALAALVGCGSGDDTATTAPTPPDAGTDATVTTDACVPDASAHCNTCSSPAADPYNACSPFAGGCIPFDAARVPAHPTL